MSLTPGVLLTLSLVKGVLLHLESFGSPCRCREPLSFVDLRRSVRFSVRFLGPQRGRDVKWKCRLGCRMEAPFDINVEWALHVAPRPAPQKMMLTKSILKHLIQRNKDDLKVGHCGPMYPYVNTCAHMEAASLRTAAPNTRLTYL